MKKFILLGLLLCSTIMYGQTSELYVYVCNAVVHTGTGERTKSTYDYMKNFNCKFNSDKSICYETDDKGKISESAYKYTRTVNGILVYEYHYNNNTAVKTLYFSKDYKKMNYPIKDHQVMVFDRVFPDKEGYPSQLW